MRSSATPSDDAKLKVTVQYRTKHGKCYELMKGAATLIVHISPPEGAETPGNWHVEARAGAASEASPSVDAWAATAAEALREIARTCPARAPSLAAFNWETVAHELELVHAV